MNLLDRLFNRRPRPTSAPTRKRRLPAEGFPAFEPMESRTLMSTVVGGEGCDPADRVIDPAGLAVVVQVDDAGDGQANDAGNDRLAERVRVVTGDVTGDGTPDIITAAGPGGGPHVKVFDGATGRLVHSFSAYDPQFTGGVVVPTGDVNNDGQADIITGHGAGGGPHIRVFNGRSGAQLDAFSVHNESFRGGVRVASADVNGDGRDDIILGVNIDTAEGDPFIAVYDGATRQGLAEYQYGPNDAPIPGGRAPGSSTIFTDGELNISRDPLGQFFR